MGVNWTDAPQWFCSSFARAAIGAGATASEQELADAGDALVARWSGEDRHFHNLKHLATVLHRVDELSQETHDPDLVRLAAWYHGAVFSSDRNKTYALEGGEQTTASAELARKELTELGVPAKNADRVAQLVDTLLRHTPVHGDTDSQVLNDADLSMLAIEPQRYKEYAAAVRAEYAHIPTRDFLRARIRILERLLRRPQIFSSPMGAAWENPARQNVEAELARLLKEQRSLPPEPEGNGTPADAEPAAPAPAPAPADV
jgi:predicted metal-dependent HD superfamily phosphohydrolase